jgi:hypothetical protein
MLMKGRIDKNIDKIWRDHEAVNRRDVDGYAPDRIASQLLNHFEPLDSSE